MPFEGSILYEIEKESGKLFIKCHSCGEKHYFEVEHDLVVWIRLYGYKCSACVTGDALKSKVKEYVEDNTMVVIETVGIPDSGMSWPMLKTLEKGAKTENESETHKATVLDHGVDIDMPPIYGCGSCGEEIGSELPTICKNCGVNNIKGNGG